MSKKVIRACVMCGRLIFPQEYVKFHRATIIDSHRGIHAECETKWRIENWAKPD